MENASKALLMTGGVLIGVLILSLAVYLFATFGADSKEIHEQIEMQQLVQYNAQYTVYEGRKDLTIYEVISVANLATENNNYYKNYGDYESAYKVTVTFSGINGLSTRDFQDIDERKKQEVLELYNTINIDGEFAERFTCSKIEYHENGRVKKISFYTTP